MSRLLINEPPLQVLPTLATKIGLNESIFLQQLHYRMSSGRMIEGRRWFNRTLKEWHTDDFPFWSPSTIQRTMENVRGMGLIDTTDEFNAPGRRDLWYTINHSRLEEIELGLPQPQPDILTLTAETGEAEKAALGAVSQNDYRPEEETEKPAPSAVSQNDYRGEPSTEAFSQNDYLYRLSQNDYLSSIREDCLTTPPPTPSVVPALEAVMVAAGVAQEWQDWREHLKLTSGPAVRLTLELWKGWTEEGMADPLRIAVSGIIQMGTRASDPAALLRSRMGKVKDQASFKVARRAADARVAQLADAPAEGSCWKAPTGQVLTVDYAQDGYVFWKEAAPEVPVAHVAGWTRAEAQA